MMTQVSPISGSFRDPAGSVYDLNDRVLRTVTDCHAAEYASLRDSGFLASLVEKDFLIGFKEVVDAPELLMKEGVRYVLEHPRLNFVSHPYEWSFSELKAAALFHLDLHLEALAHGATLSDASAYNVQFSRGHAFFIDLLSFRRYREGEFWLAHRQYCEQFLNPLLLRSECGIAHNAWYRGNLEGIPTEDLAKLLPTRSYASWSLLSHVILPNYLQNKSRDMSSAELTTAFQGRKLPLTAFRGLLSQLRRFISKLQPRNRTKTTWGTYSVVNTYTEEERRQKKLFISEFTKAIQPRLLLDFGCNTGDYSIAALEAGAEEVIGFDFDQVALDLAFSRACQQNLAFTPLFLDAANPSPNQGWRQQERKGLEKRARADAIVALAFEHHLAIARNVPLQQVLEWLTDFAPNGIIEFVRKEDPTIQKMLSIRSDIFPDYTEENFVQILSGYTKIEKVFQVSESGRKLFWYSPK